MSKELEEAALSFRMEVINKNYARIVARILIGEEEAGTVVILSGTTADVEDFFCGRCTWKEIQERWFKKSK